MGKNKISPDFIMKTLMVKYIKTSVKLKVSL